MASSPLIPPGSVLGLAENSDAIGTTIPIERGLVGAAIREKRVIHVSDVRKDSRYHMVNPETRSEMTVPLIYKGTAIGVLDIEHTRLHYFTEDHERAMTTLAAQIAIALENAQLYQRVTQQEQRLERDLAMAREVQLRLLPPAKPQHKRAEFAARFLPARTIGGDLYDFLQYDVNRSAIALGDVSGKAAPAALYAALVSGIMRSVANQHLSPSEMLRTLNDALQERKLDSQYVTMLYGLWNDENLTIQIANGGSVQPLFCRGEEIETIRAEGFPLGMFPNATWEEFSISTQPGDSVVFFSDGIVDAQNSTGEMFGNDRLIATVKKHHHKSASRLAESILTDVGRFQGKRDRFDDETVVVSAGDLARPHSRARRPELRGMRNPVTGVPGATCRRPSPPPQAGSDRSRCSESTGAARRSRRCLATPSAPGRPAMPRSRFPGCAAAPRPSVPRQRPRTAPSARLPTRPQSSTLAARSGSDTSATTALCRR